MLRLLHKLLDHAITVCRHYTAAPRVRNLIYSQRRGRLSLLMHPQHTFEVRTVQDIRVEHPEELVLHDPVAIGAKGSRAAQQLLLYYDANPRAIAILAEEFADGSGVRVQIDEHFLDAKTFAHLQPDREHRRTPNRNQALGDCVRYRSQS